VKDFLIASIFASCAFCAAVSASQHAAPVLPATASARSAADPLEAYFIPPSFDIETAPPQPEPEPDGKPAPARDAVDLSSAD